MGEHRRAPNATSWSDLPPDIISNIERQLRCPADLSRLRSVCKNWRSSRNPKNVSILSPFLPRIIPNANLPFIDRSHDRVILVERAVFLVEPQPHRWSPPSRGWLLTVEETVPGKLRILYPLSKNRVKSLPSNCPKYLDLSKFRVSQVDTSFRLMYERDGFDVHSILRVVLCSGYIAMILYGAGILLGLNMKTGNWSYVRHSLKTSFSDVISYGGNHVRAVDYKGNVYIIDHRATKVVKILKSILPHQGSHSSDRIILLRSKGRLIAASRIHKNDHKDDSVGVDFRIHALNEAQLLWYAYSDAYITSVLFISSDWSFILNSMDVHLDLSHYSPKPERPRDLKFVGRPDPKQSISGDYVIYEESLYCAHAYKNTSRLYEGAGLNLRIGVYFFDKDNVRFWRDNHCCNGDTMDVLWPPPTWFWPETYSSAREDDELDIPNYIAQSSSKKGQEHSITVNASTRPVTTNKQVSRAKLTSVGQTFNQNNSMVGFEGFNIKSNLVPTLQKVSTKYGNILTGCKIRNADMIARALESLATALNILETNSGRSLNKTGADDLSSVLCDLKLMNFRVEWLVPFVNKAVVVHKSRPLIDSLKEFGRAKAQAEEMKLKVLDELAKLDEVEEDLVLVSETLPALQSMDFDRCLSDGLY